MFVVLGVADERKSGKGRARRTLRRGKGGEEIGVLVGREVALRLQTGQFEQKKSGKEHGPMSMFCAFSSTSVLILDLTV